MRIRPVKSWLNWRAVQTSFFGLSASIPSSRCLFWLGTKNRNKSGKIATNRPNRYNRLQFLPKWKKWFKRINTDQDIQFRFKFSVRSFESESLSQFFNCSVSAWGCFFLSNPVAWLPLFLALGDQKLIVKGAWVWNGMSTLWLDRRSLARPTLYFLRGFFVLVLARDKCCHMWDLWEIILFIGKIKLEEQ